MKKERKKERKKEMEIDRYDQIEIDITRLR